MTSQNVGNVSLYFEASIRIRIRIKVKGRVRIRIKATSRIRIRIKVMHIRNQCCGSGINIPDPDFYPSRILDPNTATKERSERNLLSYLFLLPQISQFCKIFYFWNAEEKKNKELWNFLPKKLSLSSQKYGFEIRDRDSEKPIQYPGSEALSATLELNVVCCRLTTRTA
jgi:hypothetical protein